MLLTIAAAAASPARGVTTVLAPAGTPGTAHDVRLAGQDPLPLRFSSKSASSTSATASTLMDARTQLAAGERP
jgi:hypothetical protein